MSVLAVNLPIAQCMASTTTSIEPGSRLNEDFKMHHMYSSNFVQLQTELHSQRIKDNNSCQELEEAKNQDMRKTLRGRIRLQIGIFYHVF